MKHSVLMSALSFDNGQDAEGAVSFEVYVDDEKTPRYRSGVMTHATKNLALDVDIKVQRP